MTGRNSGFTLIELMITVAVVAILATIAYPSYRFALVRSNRAEAQAFLMDIAQREQQFLMDSRRYAASASDLGLSTPAKVDKFYTVNIVVAAAPPTFIATATPRPGSMQVSDDALSINNLGTKTPPDKW